MARTSTKTQLVEEPNKIPPAYFTGLEVENVLCFKNKQVLDLSDKNGNPAQWTVILGDNGVGKTTLLRCLARMEPYLSRGVPDHNWRTLSPDHMLPLFYSLSEEELGTLYKSQVNINALLIYGFSLNNFKKSLPKTINSQIEKMILNFSLNPSSSDERKASFIKKDLFELKCYGYGANRKIGNTSLSEFLSSDRNSTLFSDNADLINAEEWLLQTDYAALSSTSEDNKFTKRLILVKEILKNLLPDVDDIRIASPTYEIPRPTAEFHTHYGWVSLSDLSLGYRSVIAWMVDLAARMLERYPESDDPLSEPAIVLVDEIDLHLHPKWQRTIMEFLTKRFQNTQFIVTAHSPLVVQAAQDANIVLLRREGDCVVIDNNPEIIDNWRVDQILTTVFDLPSGRSAKLDPWLEEREIILTKSHLTQEDKARLNEIAEEIGDLPTGETPEDIRAMDIIRRAAKLLEQQEKS
ncbi:MAG: AAA family ATPase [Snowella sp.]|nr:AAA family ATPase [Snowella sp.]